MKFMARQLKWLCAVALFLGVAACSENTDLASTSHSPEISSGKMTLDVY